MRKYIVIIILGLTSCKLALEHYDGPDTHINVINNTDLNLVYHQVFINSSNNGEEILQARPWFNVDNEILLTMDDLEGRILPSCEIGKITLGDSVALKEYFKEGDQKLIFILELNTLLNKTWKEVAENQMYLKKYKFNNWNDLKKINFEIIINEADLKNEKNNNN